jgi:hypothetical protein
MVPRWLTRSRRLCREDGRRTAQAEALSKIAMIRLMAARHAGDQTRYRNIGSAMA